MILADYIKQVKSDLADIGAKTMFGKTCKEIVNETLRRVIDMKSDKPLKNQRHQLSREST